MENHNHRGFVQTAGDVEQILTAVGSPMLHLPDGRDARVDNAAAVRALREAGYAGRVSVEYAGEEPSRTAVSRALAYVRTSSRADARRSETPGGRPGRRGRSDGRIRDGRCEAASA